MNPNDKEIERMLSEAPQPRPPASLKAVLVRDLETTQLGSSDAAGGTPRWSPAQPRWGAWLNSWWPVVVTGCLTLASLAVMAVQQVEINRLRQSPPTASRARTLPAAPGALSSTRPTTAQVPLDDRQDLERLRQLVQQLQTQIAELEALNAANDRMRLQIAAAGEADGDGQSVEQQKAKAYLIMCVNNLKQLGLSARVWATDNDDIFPPNILSMSNEIAAPKVLICPSDIGRQPAPDWSSYSAANCSYEYLAASGTSAEPDRVAFRCPIHGNITLCDGSVQAEAAKKHPENLVSRDGKLYYSVGTPANAQVAAQAGQPAMMDLRMMMRYGLLPKGMKIAEATNPVQTDQMMQRRGGATNSQAATEEAPRPMMMDLRMMMRYGLLPKGMKIVEATNSQGMDVMTQRDGGASDTQPGDPQNE